MDNLFKLRYLDFVEKKDDIWFPNLHFNALMKVNKSSGEIQIVDKFPNYEVWEKWLYIAVYTIDEKMIFVPHRSQEIVYYDTITEKFSSIDLNLDIVGETGGYFLSAFAYKNYVYMFPAYTRYIVRFDIRKDSIEYFDFGLTDALKNFPDTTVCFIKEFEIVGHKIYIPFAMLNAIAVFDLEEEKLVIKYLDIDEGCSTIKYIDGYFYLASCRKHQIYRWDEETEEITMYDTFPMEFKSKNYVFSCSFIISEKIIFAPLESNMFISFDLQTKEICCEKKLNNQNIEPWNTYFVKKVNDRIISMITDVSTPCLFEYQNRNLRYTPYYVESDLFNMKTISDFLIKNMFSNIIIENEEILKEYIEIIKNSSILIAYSEMRKYGKSILEQI